MVAGRDDAQGADDWPLIGRDAEARALAAAVDATTAATVAVVAAPGVGRTRLVRTAFDLAERAGRPVRWAAGAAAATAVPLGALAHLIPRTEPSSDPFALLHGAMSALTRTDRRPVVVVDDAHLLDALSVTLLHQLATTGAATLVISAVDGGGPLPEGLAMLWKHGSAVRLGPRPLARPDTGLLLQAVLGGEIDRRTAQRLWWLSGGHPLFLRQLVEAGLTSGALARDAGLWFWDGVIEVSHRLTEIVLALLPPDGTPERDALDVLAVGGALDLGRLVGISGEDAVGALERRGLVRVQRVGTGLDIRIGHPLYAAVLHTVLPHASGRRIRRRLVTDPSYPPSAAHLVRMGVAAADDPVLDHGLLTSAADAANAALDHRLAERLARSASGAPGAGPDAHLALLEAVTWLGRSGNVDQSDTTTPPGVTTESQTARHEVMRAVAALDRRPGSAADRLRDVAARLVEDEPVATLQGVRALCLFRAGRAREALAVGVDVLDATPPTGAARPVAAGAVASALAVSGRSAEAIRIGNADLSPGSAVSALETLGRHALAHGELIALTLAGRTADLDRRAVELHDRCLDGPAWAGDAVAAMHLGRSALAAGRLGRAVRWLTEATHGMARHDPTGWLPMAAASLAQVQALSGAPEAARAALDLVARDDPGRERTVIEPHVLLARAWVASADGHDDAATALALAAADRAGADGQFGVQVLMLQAATSLGGAARAAPELRALVDRVDGALVGVCVDHAEAAAAGSGSGLDGAAAAFERLGVVLLAADAAAAAALAHRAAGDRTAAAASTTVATRLAVTCGGARTPALSRLTLPRLTGREREVAELAADGLHNQDIARRLVLSVRTVEAHLASSYVKLGIRRRSALRAALPAGA